MHIIETMRYFFTKRFCLTRRVGSKLLKGYGEKTFSKTQTIMRELKKIRMKDVIAMQDREMKMVRGGSGYYGGSGGYNPGGSGGSGCCWCCTIDAYGTCGAGEGAAISSDLCWDNAEKACPSPSFGIAIWSC